MRSTRLEFSEGSSRKFWVVEVSGARHTVRFGKIGTAGQSKTKEVGQGSAFEAEAIVPLDSLVWHDENEMWQGRGKRTFSQSTPSGVS
jgi:predicted DNA-binding WGR domain protein